MFGYPYWSLANYLKHKVKNAVQYISSFENAVAHEARKRGVDGVVCGHIHRAEITDIDGVMYCNDGDWVESCSALVEDMNGRLAHLVVARDARARPHAGTGRSRRLTTAPSSRLSCSPRTLARRRNRTWTE